MPDEQRSSKLHQLTQITQIISSLSIVVGILAAVFTIYSGSRNAKMALAGVRLSTISTIKEFIDADAEARQAADRFMASEYSKPEALHQLIEQKGSGKRAYDSDELKDLRLAGHHYEMLAALVKLDYVDFKLVFETIPFPEDIWGATTQFRTELRTQNWSGKGKGLPDFWGNLDYLEQRYEDARRNESRNQYPLKTAGAVFLLLLFAIVLVVRHRFTKSHH